MRESGVFEKPQINLACSTVGRMRLVCLCAGLAIFQSSFSDGFASLLLALTACIAALGTEAIALYKKGRVPDLLDSSALATALVMTILLPNKLHPLYAFLGAVFAIAVVKHSFGGLGSNWLNPAIGGWLFIRLSWPGVFKEALEGSQLSLLGEALARGAVASQGSPLSLMGIENTGGLDGIVRSFLNRTVLASIGTELPSGYVELFASPYPGIIADRGVLAFLLGTVILCAAKANRFWVPVVYLAVFSLLTRIAGALPYGGAFWNGDILFALFTGGTLSAAFLSASDPVTGAKSVWGALGAAVAGGLLAFLFRYPGGEPYGAVFAAAFINALLPLVRHVENHFLYEKRVFPEGGAL